MDIHKARTALDQALAAEASHRLAEHNLSEFHTAGQMPTHNGTFSSLEALANHREAQENWNNRHSILMTAVSRAEHKKHRTAHKLAIVLEMPTASTLRFPHPDPDYPGPRPFVIVTHRGAQSASVEVESSPTDQEIDEAYQDNMPF